MQKSDLARILTFEPDPISGVRSVYGAGNMAHRGAYQIADRRLILEADAPGLEEYLQPTDWAGGTID